MNWLNIGPSLSSAFKFDFTDTLKVVRHAAIVAAAAGLTVVVNNVASLDLGPYTVVIIPVVSSALNALLRFVKDNENV